MASTSSTQSYENVAFSAAGKNNAESHEQSNSQQEEPYENLQNSNPEPVKNQKMTTNRAACNRQYLCLGILLGVVGCLAVLAIGFAVAAWKNSMDAQGGVGVESIWRELEEKLERLSVTQNNMKSSNDDMATRLINMENMYYATVSRFSNVENETSGNEIMINEIKSQLLETQNMLQNVQSTNDDLTTRLENDDNKIRLNIKHNETDTRISAIENILQLEKESAFMAVMTVGRFLPEKNDVIPFNTAPVNPGSNYDTSSYVYTCPQHGLYIFSFSLYSSDIDDTTQNTVSGTLMVDGVAMADVYSRNSDPDHWQVHQAATTAVVDCPAGGTVWVQCQFSNVKMWGTMTSPRTVFTGYAIMLY